MLRNRVLSLRPLGAADGAGQPWRRVSTTLYNAVGNVTGTLSPAVDSSG